ncbi:helix-turn-helix domain-containing protein [Ammoniphilus sp. 3BR4]|uniref:helix-turn-helix domain-containing protein n=1 Tax=Ammoniphilus sp. 3BR4 TaxID=3158265 RepID=UPI0034672570
MTSNKLGQFIQEQRKNQNLTQEQLGELAGYSRSHIAKIEQGIKTASDKAIFDIAQVLNIDDEVLLDLMDDEVEMDKRKKNVLLELYRAAKQTEDIDYIKAVINLFEKFNASQRK